MLSPALGRLGEAAQAERCPPEICAHPHPRSRSASTEHPQAVPERALPGDGTASKENHPAAHRGWQELPKQEGPFIRIFPSFP